MVIILAYLCPNQTGPAKGAAVSPFTYIASFGATWLPLPWLNPAKHLPRRVCAGMLELLIELLNRDGHSYHDFQPSAGHLPFLCCC
jgi:hypothetical protein